MFTAKDIFRIIAAIIGAILIVYVIMLLISKLAPFLVGAIVFIPWLGEALSKGGDV